MTGTDHQIDEWMAIYRACMEERRKARGPRESAAPSAGVTLQNGTVTVEGIVEIRASTGAGAATSAFGESKIWIPRLKDARNRGST